MFSHTLRTVRIAGISRDTTKASLEDYANVYCTTHSGQKRVCGCFPVRRRVDGKPVVSLAPQREKQIGTITFPSEELKKNAPKIDQSWAFDDAFNGLTVLYSAAEPDLDICAVHGLNGNAFETWAWDDHMWLRDFLPSHPQLKTSRVMTYGYSSLLKDRGNRSSLEEWAHGLLGSVSSVRESESERSRPIIFVCHSLGGLVAREAMIQLGREPDRHEGIDLKRCGLLFLATPHSGSTAAVWNPYLVQAAELAGVRAVDYTSLLEAFNKNSVNSQRDFRLLRPVPPFVCLYETRDTPVAGTLKLIVSEGSAGLNGVPARPMDDVNHREICKFPRDSHPGYIQIVDCLKGLKESLAGANAAVDEPPKHGQLRGTALQQPVNGGTEEARDGNLHQQDQLENVVKQQGSNHSIQAGEGQGGKIVRGSDGLTVGGGRATGASMSLRDLQSFMGTVEGGQGAGATIQT